MKILILLIFIFSCKSQEEIQREQMVDNMAVQMQQGQKLSAEYAARTQNLEEKLTQKIGTLETIQHNNDERFSKEIELSKENMNQLRTELDEQKQTLLKITHQMDEQKKYLDKLLASLNKLTNTKPRKKRSDYDEAMYLYKKGKYKKAQNQLLKLNNNKKIKGKKKARVIHNLGMIAYMDKKYPDAITLFSRLYTKYPKSPYTAHGLLYLSKSFIKLKKRPEAKQVLEEFIKKHPKSKYKKEAVKLLKKL